MHQGAGGGHKARGKTHSTRTACPGCSHSLVVLVALHVELLEDDVGQPRHVAVHGLEAQGIHVGRPCCCCWLLRWLFGGFSGCSLPPLGHAGSGTEGSQHRGCPAPGRPVRASRCLSPSHQEEGGDRGGSLAARPAPGTAGLSSNVSPKKARPPRRPDTDSEAIPGTTSRPGAGPRMGLPQKNGEGDGVPGAV